MIWYETSPPNPPVLVMATKYGYTPLYNESLLERVEFMRSIYQYKEDLRNDTVQRA